MKFLSSIRLFTSALFSRSRMEHELDDELGAHIRERAADLERSGLSRSEAERRARLEFGGYQKFKEECREALGPRLFDTLVQDLRYAIRMLRGSPGFTTVAVLTLALGIGANTAIFSVVEAVLLRPLPFKDPERVVDLWQNNPQHGDWQGETSYPEFLDWKKQSSVFESMAVYRDSNATTLLGTANPVRLHGGIVSTDFFRVLGVNPQMGRSFDSEQDVPGGAKVAVISNALWRTQFHSDPHVVGRSVSIEEKDYRIVGVMPPGFEFPILTEPIDLWIPLATYDGTMPSERGDHIYWAFARLREGVGFEEATSQINAIENRLAVQYPDSHIPGDGANVSPLLPDVVGGTRQALLILFGAVTIVLLIACANVANLILVRAAGRSREFTIRRALGARRARLVRQLLTESVLLGGLAGSFGLILGYWATGVLLSAGPHDIPRLADVRLDGRVFAFTLGISLLTTVLFGLVPALRTSRSGLGEGINERALVGGAKNRNRLRDALTVSEVALSLVMVVAAGLLLRTLWRLERVNTGFDPANVLTFNIDLPSRYSDQKTSSFYDELLTQIRGVPGVEQVSAVFPLPLSGDEIRTGFEIEGHPALARSPITAGLCVAGRGYFQTMHIPLMRGREFAEGDGESGHPVAIINQAFAARYFPNEDPLGKRIKPNAETNGTPAQMSEIIGISADTKVTSLREESLPSVFVPIRQFPIGALSVVIRSAQSPGMLLSSVRDRVQAIEPAALLFRGKTLDQYLGTSLGQPRFNALLLSVFGALAMVLAIVGLYGAVAYQVSQRTSEIGIRMALGALPSAVLRLVLASGVRLALTGGAIGTIGALMLTRLMKDLLFGIGITDPVTYLGVAILMAGATVAACYIPARRATRVDPMVALRHE
jgi:predicted permease